MKGITYPEDFYLIRDESGKTHWYLQDPYRMTIEERRSKEVNLESILIRHYGTPSIHNPLRVRPNCGLYTRAEKFTAMRLSFIRTGNSGLHVEDNEGSFVEIEEMKNDDNYKFPLIGNIVDITGEIISSRRYSMEGECEDNDPRHQLLFVKNSVDYALINHVMSYAEVMSMKRKKRNELDALKDMEHNNHVK